MRDAGDSVTTQPGIYHDIPFDEYLSWDAISNSRLGYATRSPLHFRDAEFGEPTKAMRLGTLCHNGYLEPLELAKRIVVMPKFANDKNNVTAKGIRSYSSATTYVESMERKFREANRDKEFVTESDFADMLGVVKSLDCNNVSRALLAKGMAEVSMLWVDGETGLTCKGRIDWLSALGAIVDLKTCRDCLRFESSIADLGYHRQMAFYRRGILALSDRRASVWIIVVEPKKPWGNMVAPLSDAALSIGESECSRLLNLIAECKTNDSWPGYSNPIEWNLPAWHGRISDDELVEVGEDI